MKVFITGGTGLVGGRLISLLKQRQHEVVLLSRRASAARERFGATCTIVEGDPMQAGPWMDAAAGCDAVIHLAGENIFGRRWNEDYKKLLIESRVKSTANVVQALARNPKGANGTPKVLVNASAIGYYGPHGDEEIDENSPPGNDFLARLCVEWEQAAQAATTHGMRVAIVRVGVVLDKGGGALGKMLLPFKMGVGGPVGSGKQWMSWIHNDDMAGLFALPLENAAASGPINGVAPQPVTNKEFSKALGRALSRPAFMPTPGFGLRLMLGEVANVVTSGQRVLPHKAKELGYEFRFAGIDGALADVLK
ncbi:MAG: TIGR01777 family oxidoreductase [Planctomycetia bacterium]|nr:TIGR01777 family oxidoreductase [Planctomycetia bacterium]